METSDLINTTIFSAFLKCPRKAHFLSIAEPKTETYFSELEGRISSAYKTRAIRTLRGEGERAKPASFLHTKDREDLLAALCWADCDTVVYDLSELRDVSVDRSARESSAGARIVPVLFSPWDKAELSENLLVCFGALALSKSAGMCLEAGTLVYGDRFRRKTVRVADYAARVNRTLGAIRELLSNGQEPPLNLNRHCAVCDFRSKCRDLAIKRDDVSLLSGMTLKDRAMALAKGVLTISQLSYGYRPRRRKRTKPDAERSAKSVDSARTRHSAAHDSILRALAIKKGMIHVVGAPTLEIDGVATFIDVEGMPDNDLFYLVGLRFEAEGRTVERTFWADGLEGERGMWEDCLQTLKSIGNARLVHYGAYETRFLRQMKRRYVLPPDDMKFVDRLIETSVNLVACIYGSIYFPTYSNGLKEIGRQLGFTWAWAHASGAAAVMLRKAWELSVTGDFKNQLIAYNMDDCRAAGVVAAALVQICAGSSSAPDSVNVKSLEVRFQRTFGKFDSALPEFAKINNAAYWNYQRSKVFVRTDKGVQRGPEIRTPSEDFCG